VDSLPSLTMRRRHLLFLSAAVVALVLTLVGVSLLAPGERERVDDVGPYAWGVQVHPDGQRQVILPGAEVDYLPGSRVLAPDAGASATEVADAEAQADIARDWLAAGHVPGAGTEFEDMARQALLDIHALTNDEGAALAGYNQNWRYVWPRDASFIAVALGVSGHTDDAVQILAFLQDVQHPDGTFEARYLPDGSGPPDSRGIQIDGTGWVMWALGQILTQVPDEAQREQILTDLDTLVDRSGGQLLEQVDTADGLPPPSADYWEHRESQLTLGTAAPVLAGLHGVAGIWAETSDPRAAEAQEAAGVLHAAIEAEFGPDGYGRYIGEGERDAATAFLLPPFQPEPLTDAPGAWQDSIAGMQRPGGGLAPGEGWAEQSLSWTPQTTLYTYAAAHNGQPELAHDWLRWVDAHRTPLGAIPEKVSPDGDPAAVAPLAWSAAMVLLALDELETNGELPSAP